MRFLASATGTVTDTYDYDAWGNQVNSTGTTPNVYLYRGEQWDPDLGLYYLRARYFNPVSGRFLSRDTYQGNQNTPASFHKYLYAGGDPVDQFDPSGRLLDNAELETLSLDAAEVIEGREIGPGAITVGLGGLISPAPSPVSGTRRLAGQKSVRSSIPALHWAR